jgi:hypothetical protein
MQEPAACGALPAQQASVHSGPLAFAGKTMVPPTSVSNSVTARIALAPIIAVRTNRFGLPESGLCFTAFCFIKLG